jgi:RNA polymerase sigma factor (sigma-70 family)
MSNSSEQTKTTQLHSTIHSEQGKLLGFISTKMPTTEDAEDILQDVFEELVEVEELMNIENIASWLYRVARNKITDWYRKRKTERYTSTKVADDEDDEPLFMADILASGETSAEDALFRKAMMEQIADTLELLPEKQKQVFVMHELDGLSLKQIAELTDTPIKTVISRKHYAVTFLRNQLRELYTEFLTN